MDWGDSAHKPLAAAMTETAEVLFERLRPVIDSIDLKTELSPTVQGAMNSASLTDDPLTSGQWVPDDELTKLVVLLDQGVITSDQYQALVTLRTLKSQA